MGVVDAGRFLDEFRPFRRGEIALARRALDEPLWLPPAELDVLRYAVRLAQLTSLGADPDLLVDRIASFRLRLLQLLAPVLPTDPRAIEAGELHRLLPRVVYLVEGARRAVAESGIASTDELDTEIAHKRLALVLGGAAGSGYVFLGVLRRLEQLGLEPSYLVGCSMGSLLGVVRARMPRFDLEELYDEFGRLRASAVFRPPAPTARFGLPAALRLDLRQALGDLFVGTHGEPLRLRDLHIPTDTLATGLGPGALTRPPDEYAHLVDVGLDAVVGRAKLGGGAVTRLVSGLVSLAISRQVLVPITLGGDPETAELPALDAAGFSAAIPMVLHYDLPVGDTVAAPILETIFKRHDLSALVDGALVSLIPARYAWQALEGGRIGSRNYALVALDAMSTPGGAGRLLAPLQRVIAATAHRDGAFWDLRVHFRRTPPLFEIFPSESRLRRAADNGEREFESTGRLLRQLLSPLMPWAQSSVRIPPWD
ncbi:MAG: patatin-like phospholipase family protein [Myxococcota bacterium]